MAERKLPVGIQSFEDLRTNNYIYVDKTSYIWKMTQMGKSFFLSRPRRFGKSLLTSTIEAYFRGEKELFRGLAIAELEPKKGQDAWQQYPIISFSLSGGDFHQKDGLEQTLHLTMSRTEEQYQLSSGNYVHTDELDLPNRFRYLIEQLYNQFGQKVVVLVDEYDKPLLEVIDDPEQEEKNRQLYKSFFSVLKDEDRYLKFVFFTGVTKFSKVSVFSDLNQLKDISLSDEFSGICGITEQELIATFTPEIDALANRMQIGREECVKKLAGMYDGYRFSPDGLGVYNPFSLLNAFQDKRLRRYWYETGTPTFLVKKLLSSDFTPERLTAGVEIDEQNLMDYRADDRDPIPLFYQTGYLTIHDYDEEFQTYSLRFPNKEVKYGFLNSLVPYIFGMKDAENPTLLKKMIQDLRSGKLESFLRKMQGLFASVPYGEGKTLNYEQVWRNQIFLVLTLLGQNIRCEVHSAIGRADCIIETEQFVYILEFKMDKPSKEALQQIIDRQYALSYLEDGRKVILAGVSFSSEKKNIEEWSIG